MNLKNATKVIDFSLETNFPLILWGETGVGKTTVIQDIAEREGYNLVILHLSTQTTEDLIGMPDPDREKGQTRWLAPEWLVMDSDERKTIYFLDEFNRYHSESVKNAMLPFLQSGKIHQHSIRPKDRVIGAANPPGGEDGVDEYDVKDIWGEALLNRMGHVVFSPSVDEWFEYAGSSVDPVTLSILHEQTEIIEQKFNSLPFEIKPSRRSIMEISSVINKKSEKWKDKNAFPVMRSYLGPEWAAMWQKARREKPQNLQVTDIIDRWDDPEVQSTVETIFSNSRTDMMNKVNEKIEKYLKSADQLSENQINNLFRYLDKLPMDVLIKVLKSPAILEYHNKFGEKSDKNILLRKFYDFLYDENKEKWDRFMENL